MSTESQAVPSVQATAPIDVGKGRPGSFLVLLVLLSAALFSRYVDPRSLYDLNPWPDTVEYVTGARSILLDHTFVIHINDYVLPSRYSLGFPLLIVPVLLVTGIDYTHAIYTVLVLDGVLIVSTFFLARILFGDVAAVCATWCVVTSPTDLYAAQHIMSDLPSTTFVVLAMVPLVGSVLLSQKFPRQLILAIVSGLVLGYACWIRQTNMMYLPIFALFLAVCGASFITSRRGMLFHKTLLIISIAGAWMLTQIPIFIYNYRTFGSIGKNGYSYWVPYWYGDVTRTFSLRNAFGEGNHGFVYVKSLLSLPGPTIFHGSTLLYLPVVVIGVATAILRIYYMPGHGRVRLTRSRDTDDTHAYVERWAAAMIIGMTIFTSVLYSLYFSPADLRFMHTVIPLMSVLAGAGFYAFSHIIMRALSHVHLSNKTVSAVLFIIVAGGMGYEVGRMVVSSCLWQAARAHREFFLPIDYTWIQLVNEHTDPSAVIVSDSVPPILFTAYQPEGSRRMMVPFKNHELMPDDRPLSSFRENSGAVKEAMKRHVQVFFVGDPASFKSLPEARGFLLTPTVSQSYANGAAMLTLYAVGLEP